MKKYTPNHRALNDVSTKTTLTGLALRQLVGIEETAQKDVAEHPFWLIAKKVNSAYGECNFIKGDSRSRLKKLGFIVGNDEDLFYMCVPPKGWTKSTAGYWTTVVDENGREHISQFFKGAIYDRNSFINITSPQKNL